MKKLLIIIVAILCGCNSQLNGQQTLFYSGPQVWTTIEWDNHYWMQGSIPKFETAIDDPGLGVPRNSISNEFPICIQGYNPTVLMGIGVTNIQVKLQYEGTIQIGTNFYKVNNLNKTLIK